MRQLSTITSICECALRPPTAERTAERTRLGREGSEPSTLSEGSRHGCTEAAAEAAGRRG